MSDLHVRQIQAAIENAFADNIDLSDMENRSSSEKTSARLSRGLAAYALSYLSSISPDDACKAVTDSYGDNGLDAVYYHPTERTLYFVQSKWRQDGTGSISLGDTQKFIKGFRDIINARWDRFNEKIIAKRASIETALNDTGTRITLVIVYSGQDQLGKESGDALNDLLIDINNPSPIVSLQVLRQGDVYSAVSRGLSGAPIDLEIALYEWGQVREPYAAIYGQVAATDVAAWFSDHRSQLFVPNIRMFLGDTEVNSGIADTLSTNPNIFWYFNNGITALCRTFAKKAIGGDTRDTGYFDCSDIRVVNGAQTVGSVAAAAAKDPAAVAKARVPIRINSYRQFPARFRQIDHSI